MKKRNYLSLVGCIFLMLGVSTGASASCGDFDVTTATQLARSTSGNTANSQTDQQPGQPQLDSSSSSANATIVGLWHIEFLVGDTVIQEAFQLWNTGGTEVHNPRVDPRSGNVCLGVWRQLGQRTFKLTHRVWAYDTTGDLQGVLHLSQTVTLDHAGNTFQSGSFTLNLYDLSGNFVAQLATGTVTGQRVVAE